MIRLLVKSHPAPDFKQVWRAGRPWPKDGTTIDYDDSVDADPTQVKDEPMRIGKATFEELKGDSRIFITQPGAADDIVNASAALIEMRAENEKLTARVAELEKQIADAKPPTAPTETGKPKK
jgi:hypothetical protein